MPTGGHNILEPAAFGNPIVFGPYMENFREIRDLFLESRAAVEVHDVTELAAESLENTPRIGLRWPPEFITCIGKRQGVFIAVLDMGCIFARIARQTSGAAMAVPSAVAG